MHFCPFCFNGRSVRTGVRGHEPGEVYGVVKGKKDYALEKISTYHNNILDLYGGFHKVLHAKAMVQSQTIEQACLDSLNGIADSWLDYDGALDVMQQTYNREYELESKERAAKVL